MAINAVGIFPNDQSAIVGSSLSIMDGTTPALAFRFATQSKSWQTANIWVTVDGVRRGGSESINSYARIGSAGITEAARSSFGEPTQSGGSYVYSRNLSSMSEVASLVDSLAYATRAYDAVRLTVEVRIVWGSGAYDFVKGSATCYLTFKPTYTATTARYTVDGLEINYTANDWERPNDRWRTAAISSGGKQICKGSVRGTASGVGKLTIPRKHLMRIPDTGETLSGYITMMGSWQDESSSLGRLQLAGVPVTNATNVRLPSITATAQADGVLVSVADSGSGGSVAPTAIDVQLVGSTYTQDRATLAPGESHLFDAVPSGVVTEWQAVAYVAGNDAYQPTVPVTAPAGPVYVNGTDVVPADGSGAVKLPYNAAVTRNARPETEAVKLAGRDRQTVGFGIGGAVTWTVSGTIATDEDEQLSFALDTTDPDAVASLPMRGLCMIRTQDGRRAQVYLTNANVSRAVGGRGIRSFSINAEEVS